jgi:hypothetical protein
MGKPWSHSPPLPSHSPTGTGSIIMARLLCRGCLGAAAWLRAGGRRWRCVQVGTTACWRRGASQPTSTCSSCATPLAAQWSRGGWVGAVCVLIWRWPEQLVLQAAVAPGGRGAVGPDCLVFQARQGSAGAVEDLVPRSPRCRWPPQAHLHRSAAPGYQRAARGRGQRRGGVCVAVQGRLLQGAGHGGGGPQVGGRGSAARPAVLVDSVHNKSIAHPHPTHCSTAPAAASGA